LTRPGGSSAHAPCELVVVGGSWGGLAASVALLRAVAAPLTVPVLLVLHRAHASQATVLERVLARGCGHPAREIGDKDPLLAGMIHVAPPDYHVLVERGQVSLSVDGPVNYSRPAIDLAFDTAALAYSDSLVVVLLSGGGRDGSAGLSAVHRRGGRTMVQDPAGAERDEMPHAAIATGHADVIDDLQGLGHRLGTMVKECAR
jgi:two-component system, chemotaxis family, protein-glutamate methylesterase/glutaminase